MSIKPCTIGPRHQWEWVKNIRIGKFRVTAHGTSGTVTLRGLYRCACGETKHGNYNGGDPRSVGGAA